LKHGSPIESIYGFSEQRHNQCLQAKLDKLSAKSKYMNESEFWEIIESVRLASENAIDRPAKLKQILADKTSVEIQEFSELYRDLIVRAYTWPLWGAAYVISGGCSDDGFDYFRDWLISEGKDVYLRALNDPDSLSELGYLEEPELEEFRYIADEVYENKTGKTLELRQRQYPSEPSGAEWEEDAVAEIFPKLASKYW